MSQERSYKYEICPNLQQEKELFSILNELRALYNSALEERKLDYFLKKDLLNKIKLLDSQELIDLKQESIKQNIIIPTKYITYTDQARELVEHKVDENTTFNNINSQLKQNILKRLDNTFNNFFDKIKKDKTTGKPRFKNQKQFKSFTYPQISRINQKTKKLEHFNCGIKLNTKQNKLTLPSITGQIKVIYHRPYQGIPKTATIKYNNGKWYLFLSCSYVPKNNIEKTDNKISGLDLGIRNYATLDDGTTFANKRTLQQFQCKIAKLQRELQNKQKGSNNRKKKVLQLAKTHEKVANIRKDNAHKLAIKLIKTHDVIILEKLNIKGMIKDNKFDLQMQISDAAWGQFITILIYKAESAGRELIFVSPENTSRTCSNCGNIDLNFNLVQTKYSCQCCNFECDRDVNAAKNIKHRGLGTSPPNLKIQVRAGTAHVQCEFHIDKNQVCCVEDSLETSAFMPG